MFQHPGAAGGADSAGAENVLVSEGDAGPGGGLAGGPALVRRPGFRQGLFLGDGDEAVVLAVFLLETVQEVPGQLHAGDLAALQLAGKLCYGFLVHDDS